MALYASSCNYACIGSTVVIFSHHSTMTDGTAWTLDAGKKFYVLLENGNISAIDANGCSYGSQMAPMDTTAS